MWSLEQLKSYMAHQLGKGDIWETQLLPQLKDIIKISMMSAWSKVEWRDNSIGLYGYDVIIDSDLKMWLLEINLCPSMEHSTKVTSHLVPKMMEDLCKVLIDSKEDTPVKNTGSYELIYEGIKVKDLQNLKSKLDLIIEGKRAPGFK
jgi:hypothetical protein